MQEPILVVFGGLPGVGKTTLAQSLSKKMGATYIRIDTIEQILLRQGSLLSGTEGYITAYALAKDNLTLGNYVISDSVNPIEETRKEWKYTAEESNARVFEIEVVCSDSSIHQKRVEYRRPDIRGHILPTWQDIVQLEYQPWETKNLTIDTCINTKEESLKKILNALF